MLSKIVQFTCSYGERLILNALIKLAKPECCAQTEKDGLEWTRGEDSDLANITALSVGCEDTKQKRT